MVFTLMAQEGYLFLTAAATMYHGRTILVVLFLLAGSWSAKIDELEVDVPLSFLRGESLSPLAPYNVQWYAIVADTSFIAYILYG